MFGSEEELVEFGRGHLPRWLVLVGVMVGSAAVLTALMVSRSPGPRHGLVTVRRPVPTPAPGPDTGLGPRLPLPDEAALDVAVSGASTWVLQPEFLSVIVAGARRSVSVSDVGLSAADATGRLFFDPATGRLWLAVTGVSPCRLIEYDAATLQRLRDLSWPQVVSSAAVLGGHLYLATGSGVADLAPDATAPQPIPGSTAGAGGTSALLAADPNRDRLLVIEPGYPGYPSRIQQYHAGTGMSPTAVSLPFEAWSMVAADGAIWVYGIGRTAGVLHRLDPATLRPVASSGPVANGDAVPGILASGSRVFWLTIGTPTSQIWCLDAATGRELHSWNTSGNVASTANVARVATTAGVYPLILGHCGG